MHSTRARGRRERFTRLERLRSRLRGHPLILLRRALAAALLLVAAVLAVTPGTDREPRVPVLVAARTLPLGSTLSEDDVRVAEVPGELRPDGALVTPDQAVDRRLVGAAREGEPLTDLRFLDARNGPPGSTTVPLRLTDAGMTRLLRSGTRVDVVTPGEGVRQARVLAENATVVSVVTPEPDRDDSPLARQNTPLVLVSVPDEQAPHVAAAALGSPVTVTLR